MKKILLVISLMIFVNCSSNAFPVLGVHKSGGIFGGYWIVNWTLTTVGSYFGWIENCHSPGFQSCSLSSYPGPSGGGPAKSNPTGFDSTDYVTCLQLDAYVSQRVTDGNLTGTYQVYVKCSD
jgi:hypothetical protein